MASGKFYQRPAFYFLIFGLFLAALILSETFPWRVEREPISNRDNPHATGRRHVFPENFALAAQDPAKAQSVQLGAEIFYQTPRFAPTFVGNGLACTNCHFQGGTQVGMLGLVGVALKYPEFDARANRVVTLQERLQSCFLRSLNGKSPPVSSPILQNLSDYVTYLATGISKDQELQWRSLDWIPDSDKIPIERLDPKAGEALYAKNCSACHGLRGQGDGWAPALWGDRTFNDGSGLGRVYTLAGFIYRAMPLSSPDSLSLETAQQIAAYLDALPRPSFPGKTEDYPKQGPPVDAVYYPQRYPENPLAVKLKGKGG